MPPTKKSFRISSQDNNTLALEKTYSTAFFPKTITRSYMIVKADDRVGREAQIVGADCEEDDGAADDSPETEGLDGEYTIEGSPSFFDS